MNDIEDLSDASCFLNRLANASLHAQSALEMNRILRSSIDRARSERDAAEAEARKWRDESARLKAQLGAERETQRWNATLGNSQMKGSL